MNLKIFLAVIAIVITQIEMKSLIATRLQKSCGPPTIKNGISRMKQRGRNAHFTCNDGFLMHGQRYAICINGKWDTEIPLCIKGICPKQSDISNGKLVVSLNSAKSEIFCESGYEIIGNQLAFCNGYNWDREIGFCGPSNDTISTSCDFESISLCGWTHDPTSDYTWTRKNGDTGALRTGPRSDHTTGIPLEGHYMLLESSFDRYNESARLISPIFKGERSQNSCFKFFYHMYGQSVGSLMVYIKPESEDIEEILKQEKFRLFKESGTKKNTWHESIVNIEEINESFQIIFEGTSIGSHLGDIAIDDVSLISSEECWNEVPNTTTIVETGGIFSIETCLNRCDESFTLVEYPDKEIKNGPGSGGFIKSCYCFNGCERVELCCPDYQTTCVFNESSYTDSTSTETGNFVYASGIKYYKEEVVTIIKEEIPSTTSGIKITENDEKIENEREMKSENVIDNKIKVDESVSWLKVILLIIFTGLIIGGVFYGVWYKLYRNFNNHPLEVRFSRDDTAELLELNHM